MASMVDEDSTVAVGSDRGDRGFWVEKVSVVVTSEDVKDSTEAASEVVRAFMVAEGSTVARAFMAEEAFMVVKAVAPMVAVTMAVAATVVADHTEAAIGS